MYETLRKDGDALVVAIPKAFAEQNGLSEGARVKLTPLDRRLLVEVPPRPRYRLVSLLAEMPEGLPRVEAWDEMPATETETT